MASITLSSSRNVVLLRCDININIKLLSLLSPVLRLFAYFIILTPKASILL
jgi:hypothetical protein